MRFNITQKVNLLVLGLFLIFGFVLGTYVIKNQRKMINHELDERATVLLNHLSVNLEYPVLIRDLKAISRLVKEVMAQKDIIYCRVDDKEGKLIYLEGAIVGTVKGFNASVATKGNKLLENEEEFILGVSDEVAEEVGKIQLAVSLTENNKKLSDIRNTIIVIVGVGVFMASLASFLLLRFFLDRPVKMLVKATERIASGDLEYKVNLKSRDEIGALASSFNKMTEDLQETTVSRDYVDNVLTSMADCLIVVNLDGTIKTVNQATLNLLGYEKSELVGKYVGIIFQNDDTILKDNFLDYLKRIGFVHNVEKIYVSKDKREIPVNFSASVMRDGGGIRGIVYAAHDIVLRKQAEEKLKKSERDLQKALNLTQSISIAAPNAHIIADPTGTIISANPAAETIFGYNTEDIVGKNVNMLAPPFSHAEYAKCLSIYFEYKTGEESEKRKVIRMPKECKAIRKNGEIFPVMLYVRESRVEDNMVFVGIIEDITKRKREEEIIKKDQEYIRSLIDCSMDMIISVDNDRNIVEFNNAAERILGYKKSEVIGKNISIFYTDIPGLEADAVVPWEKEHFVGEILNKRKNGEIFTAFIEASFLKNSNGEVIGSMGISRDITESKRAEEELRQAKVKAEAASKAKGEFLANMSHEIRTPLNGIIGMLELIMDADSSENLSKLINTMNIEANTLLSLVNNILDFSKIEAGGLELEKIPFDLKSTIDDVINSFVIKAEQKGLGLNSFLPQSVPNQLIGDPERLKQILRNLIANAVKFTHRGEISIMIKKDKGVDKKVKLLFSIKDSGIGIAKNKQKSIFESFSQVDGSTTRKYGGTGLGTTISKQLVKLMGGEIWLESEEGRGSTFWFTATFNKQKEQKVVKTRKRFNLAGKKVLVVDDHSTSQHTVTKQLIAWGCQIVEAFIWQEAITIFKESLVSKEPFDIIFMDLQMPEINGSYLVRKIRKIECSKEIPVIMIIPVKKIEEMKKTRQTGIQGYIAKPINNDSIRSILEPILGLSMTKNYNQDSEGVTKQHLTKVGSGEDVRLLLVEDYPANQQVAMGHLHKAGYNVDLVENGLQAVNAFKEKHYDLIFMDIQMPVMDGYEATTKIRVYEKEQVKRGAKPLSRVTIIGITAHATKEYHEQCLNVGMDDYISKPLRKGVFLALVDRWIRKITKPCSSVYFGESNSVDPHPVTTGNRQPVVADSKLKNDIPLDFEMALDEFDDDKEYLMKVVNIFLENVKKQIIIMQQAIKDGDTETIRKEAHAIKGGAATLMADNLAGVAERLENVGKSGNIEKCLEIVNRLEDELGLLELFVKDK